MAIFQQWAWRTCGLRLQNDDAEFIRATELFYMNCLSQGVYSKSKKTCKPWPKISQHEYISKSQWYTGVEHLHKLAQSTTTTTRETACLHLPSARDDMGQNTPARVFLQGLIWAKITHKHSNWTVVIVSCDLCGCFLILCRIQGTI